MSILGALKSIPRNEQPEDYRQDGLLYCGNCKTPKEFDVAGMGLMPIMCQCIKEADDKSRAQMQERQRKECIQDNIRRGITDFRYLRWTFENDDLSNPKATAIAKRYVEEWAVNKTQNKGLLFIGDVGVGKTYLACAIANALLQKGVTVFVTDLPTLLKRATDFDDDITADIERCSLLVIDDVGVERSTEFAMEQAYSIINTRYKTGKPLIVTTNLNGAELEKPKDADKRRIYDRILEMCCTTVVMSGESRRPGIRKEKQKA